MWLLQTPPDLAYGTDPAQRLGLFAPKAAKTGPLVVFVHGGAWQGGNRHEYDRLSPKVQHPAHLHAAGVRVETLLPTGRTHDGIIRNLATPGDPVAKAIVAFVKRR